MTVYLFMILTFSVCFSFVKNILEIQDIWISMVPTLCVSARLAWILGEILLPADYFLGGRVVYCCAGRAIVLRINHNIDTLSTIREHKQ